MSHQNVEVYRVVLYYCYLMHGLQIGWTRVEDCCGAALNNLDAADWTCDGVYYSCISSLIDHFVSMVPEKMEVFSVFPTLYPPGISFFLTAALNRCLWEVAGHGYGCCYATMEHQFEPVWRNDELLPRSSLDIVQYVLWSTWWWSHRSFSEVQTVFMNIVHVLKQEMDKLFRQSWKNIV